MGASNIHYYTALGIRINTVWPHEDMHVTINYHDLFNLFCNVVCRDCSITTKEATKLIKSFFSETYGAGRHVFPSDGNPKHREFLLDVLILNFLPGDPIAHPSVSAYLAVESELGGEGGTSAGPIRRNVEYDFAKLLLVKAQHKVMVFTSLPLRGENDAQEARVRALQEMYAASGEHVSILLIHVQGMARKTSNGVGQVGVSLQRSCISGYLLSPGLAVAKWNCET